MKKVALEVRMMRSCMSQRPELSIIKTITVRIWIFPYVWYQHRKLPGCEMKAAVSIMPVKNAGDRVQEASILQILEPGIIVPYPAAGLKELSMQFQYRKRRGKERVISVVGK